MSTETEKLPIYIEGPQIQTRLEDVAAAFRRLAMLRLAEAELPRLIADAQAEADAACLALGLSGDHRDVGRLGAPVPARPEVTAELIARFTAGGEDVPATEGGPMPPAGGKPREHEQDATDSAPRAADARREPEHEHPAAESPAADETESAGDPTPAEAEAHTPAEGVVEPEGGSVPPPGSPLTPRTGPSSEGAKCEPAPVRPDAERRGGRPLGDVSQACLRVLELAHPHAATAADIVTASGYSLDKVRGRLYALSSAGRISRDDSRGEPMWTLAVEDEAPVVTAALAASGVLP